MYFLLAHLRRKLFLIYLLVILGIQNNPPSFLHYILLKRICMCASLIIEKIFMIAVVTIYKLKATKEQKQRKKIQIAARL